MRVHGASVTNILLAFWLLTNIPSVFAENKCEYNQNRFKAFEKACNSKDVYACDILDSAKKIVIASCGKDVSESKKDTVEKKELIFDAEAPGDSQLVLVKSIQKCLSNQGLGDGVIDGIAGPKTIAAVDEFYKNRCLTRTSTDWKNLRNIVCEDHVSSSCKDTDSPGACTALSKMDSGEYKRLWEKEIYLRSLYADAIRESKVVIEGLESDVFWSTGQTRISIALVAQATKFVADVMLGIAKIHPETGMVVTVTNKTSSAIVRMVLNIKRTLGIYNKQQRVQKAQNMSDDIIELVQSEFSVVVGEITLEMASNRNMLALAGNTFYQARKNWIKLNDIDSKAMETRVQLLRTIRQFTEEIVRFQKKLDSTNAWLSAFNAVREELEIMCNAQREIEKKMP